MSSSSNESIGSLGSLDFSKLTFRQGQDAVAGNFQPADCSEEEAEENLESRVQSYFSEILNNATFATTNAHADAVLMRLQTAEGKSVFQNHPAEHSQLYLQVIERFSVNNTAENNLLDKARQVYNKAKELDVWKDYAKDRATAEVALKV